MNMFEAVSAGDCEQILKHIVQVSDFNERLESPLILAIQKRVEEPIKLLAHHGADINAKDQHGMTPLHWAIEGGQVATVALILDLGADINAKSKTDTALNKAVLLNQLPIVQRLLERGADVNQPSTDGRVPLIEAAYKGNDAMVALLLLRHGADPNRSTANNLTALLWAAQKCSHATVKALLDAGANPWHKSQSGHTTRTMATDYLTKHLICEYQQDGGPSWLVRELSARGLEWSVIYDLNLKLAKEHCATQQTLSTMSLRHFTHAYLLSIGVDSFYLRQVLIALRLQSTWLGARLAACGVGVAWLGVCEVAVFDTVGTATEASFAQVLPDELSDECLCDMGIVSGFVRRIVREVHSQVCEEFASNKKRKMTCDTTSADIATPAKRVAVSVDATPLNLAVVSPCDNSSTPVSEHHKE